MKMNAYSDSVLELSILIEFGIDLFLTHIHICLLEMKSDKTKKKEQLVSVNQLISIDEKE